MCKCTAHKICQCDKSEHIQKMKEAREEGKTVQFLREDGEWVAYKGTLWLECNTFRIKPEEAAAPHKHAALIKAWADGAEIEWQSAHMWIQTTQPNWNVETVYRIKPVPKPDVISFSYLSRIGTNATDIVQHPTHNIKHIYDGETGKLKSVSLL